MKESEIKFKVSLDDENIPEKIEWDADEKEKKGYSETKSISVSLWDSEQKNSLRIDLWTKDMPLAEMKRFYIDCLGGIGQTILNATGDQYMSNEINGLCDRWCVISPRVGLRHLPFRPCGASPFFYTQVHHCVIFIRHLLCGGIW